jgi:hypothetical protein
MPFFPLAYSFVARERLVMLWVSAGVLYALGIVLVIAGVYVVDTVLLHGIEFASGMTLAYHLRHACGKPTPRANIFLMVGSLTGFGVLVALAQTSLLWNLPVWLYYPVLTLGNLSFFAILWHLSIRICIAFRYPVWASFLSRMSVATYCSYLFHRPIWSVAVKLPVWDSIDTFQTPVSTYVQLSYLVGIGIPVIILIGYSIQTSYDRLVTRLLV